MNNVVSIDLGMNGFPDPRAFQRYALDDIREGFAEGHRNQMVMAPTGSGKTYIGLRAAHMALRRGKRVIFLCDRRSLIDQTVAKAKSYGLAYGILMAGHEGNVAEPFQIASTQTISSRGDWPPCDLLIVDEAHTRYRVWTKAALAGNLWVMGLSATPFADGLGKVFSRLVCPTTMHELTEKGLLAPMRAFSCRRIDMTGVQSGTKDEWEKKNVEERGVKILGGVVAEWLARASDRKTIAFGPTVRYCEELCRQFNDAGVMAAVFSYRTEEIDRKAFLDDFSKPDSGVRVLISVDALAKGFDIPDVSCVIDCRPLRRSFSTAMQMWGRGARSHPRKEDFLLLDHSGNLQRFLGEYEDIYFNGLSSLDQGALLDLKVRSEPSPADEARACPECGFTPFHSRCMSCGHASPPKVLIQEPGEMKEVVIWRTLAASYADLWAQICSFAREKPWIKNKEGYAKKMFWDLTNGTWPPRGFRLDTAPPVEVGDRLRGRLMHEHIAFQKKRAA